MIGAREKTLDIPLWRRRSGGLLKCIIFQATVDEGC